VVVEPPPACVNPASLLRLLLLSPLTVTRAQTVSTAATAGAQLEAAYMALLKLEMEAVDVRKAACDREEELRAAK
jgi:hypothetical protein